jgi:hypothetical protein
MMLKRIVAAAVLLLGLTAPAWAQRLPAPVLRYVDQYPVLPGLIRVDLTVLNWKAYSPALFAASPNLPPCGLNPAASRTWVDIHHARTGQTLYGFCALSGPADLAHLWFATSSMQRPFGVYITLTDRLRQRTVRSNVVRIPVAP